MLSTQLTVSQILQMLTQNPGVGVFSLQTSDYPAGITRAGLVAALAANIAATNFDSTTGAWNSQVYAPGILLNGGGQIPASPSAVMVEPAGITPLPVMNPVGAAAMGSSSAVITTPSEVK
jgi:hypothetical protein